MVTVIELWCKFKNYQGCTIHQVMEEFKTLDRDSQDRFCGQLVDNIIDISDYWHARDIMRLRLQCSGLVTNKI